ncbi:MAG: type II toxin-antitoxin system VapC family toxin [Anaerolineales bacterium]
MSKFVLDASALLALLNGEPGAEMIQDLLPATLISAVNLAEVVTRLSLVGMPEDQIEEVLSLLGLDVRPFDDKQAFQSGFLANHTHSYGLSLGDRACLSLAIATDSIALTADKVWQDLKTSAKVRLIR